MNIAFFTDTFLPATNGVVTSILQTVSLLAANGHKVLIVCPVPSVKLRLPRKRNIQYIFLPALDAERIYPDLRLSLVDITLLGKIKKFKPDVIHTHTPGFVGFQGLLTGKRLKIPLITTHHTNFMDKETLNIIGMFKSRIASQLQKGAGEIIKFFLNRHDRILVPTQDTIDLELSRWKIQVPVSVLSTPVDITALREGKANGLLLRKNLGIKKSILFSGRLSEEKHIEEVLRAFQLSLEKIPDLKCVIIGDGADRERLFELAHELNILPHIIWTGKIPYETLLTQGYYYLGDIFTTMSCFETQGLSTIEAMACDLPVIAANARATKELLQDSAILVPPHNYKKLAQEIVSVVESKQLYAQLAKKSKTKAEQFGQDVFYKKLLNQYHLIQQAQ